jgi:hypothetical protein
MNTSTMIKNTVLGLVVVAGLLITLGVGADASGPTQAPPGGNASAPLNISSVAQTKTGGISLNTGNATYGLLVPYGKVGFGTLTPGGIFDVASGGTTLFRVTESGTVGIGVAAPSSMLAVAGGVQVGDDSQACSSAKAGTMRWNGGILQVCDGTQWTSSCGPGAATICETNGQFWYDGSCHVCNYNNTNCGGGGGGQCDPGDDQCICTRDFGADHWYNGQCNACAPGNEECECGQAGDCWDFNTCHSCSDICTSEECCNADDPDLCFSY